MPGKRQMRWARVVAAACVVAAAATATADFGGLREPTPQQESLK